MAVLWHGLNPIMSSFLRETEVAANALGMQLQSLEVRDPDDLESAFVAATREHANALVVMTDPFTDTHRSLILEIAARHRLPAMYGDREYVDAGGLMAYAVSHHESYRRAAHYVDRILKGARPADLPVEQVSEFDFVINLPTAQAIGLTIPPHVLLQATEVIQ